MLQPNNMNREDGLDPVRSWMSPPPQGYRMLNSTVLPNDTDCSHLSRMVWLSPSLFYPCLFWSPTPHPLAQLTSTTSYILLQHYHLLRATHILPYKTLPVLNRQATSFLFLPLTSLPLIHCHMLHSSFLLHLFTYHWSLLSVFILPVISTHHPAKYNVATPTVVHVLPLYITVLSHAKVATTTSSQTPPCQHGGPTSQKDYKCPQYRTQIWSQVPTGPETKHSSVGWQTSRKLLLYSAQLTLLGLPWRWREHTLWKSIYIFQKT
jgi:hypothetical protein